eukprot:m.117428 g.117428  ORF g.117428 m.117428 type:complete len:110 (+) comp13195_c0_seq1:99-428(+)
MGTPSFSFESTHSSAHSSNAPAVSSAYSRIGRRGELAWVHGPFLPPEITEPCAVYKSKGGRCQFYDGVNSTSEVFLVCDKSADTPVVVPINDNFWVCSFKAALKTKLAC